MIVNKMAKTKTLILGHFFGGPIPYSTFFFIIYFYFLGRTSKNKPENQPIDALGRGLR